MNLTTILLIALGLSADAFAVSLSSGLVIRHIKLNKILKIALFFGVFQAIIPLIGCGIARNFQGLLLNFDHWIAFILLSWIGGKMIYEALQEDEN
ncbi:manganese efflux pump [Spirulina subsalsa FACHB-351]|uniref:Manganese efflux pump n=1 Tax=Spirulina subsalsa FACHB-351 TaxID=234711 RepID=A0ABT3LAE4_9CYAN|nr:manganese efflux pump [Spirulina subsalsa FACHB-351]